MKLTYVTNEYGEWCGVYIDNDLYTEGHSISTWDWLYLIEKYGAEINDTQQREVCGEWLEGCGNLPQKLADIAEEVFV